MEAVLNTLSGTALSWCVNVYLQRAMGISISAKQGLILTAFLTVVSLLRTYLVRRLFNWLHQRAFLPPS